MNNRWKRMLAGLMLVCMFAAAGPAGLLTSWAANTKIAFSDPSVMVGNEVSVTVKVTSDTALGTADIMLSYDPAVLEFVSGTNANGGAGAIKLLGTMESTDQKAFSFTLKFKTIQAGNTQIQVSSQEIYDADSNLIPLDKQGSSTVKVTSPASFSKDATLKSLKISPGTLTPEFSAAVESYTASVEGSADKLVVNAVAANAGASVSLQGAESLQAGENQVVVKVTAEDKQTIKNYTILVTKAEGGAAAPSEDAGGETEAASFGDLKATIDGALYAVAVTFDESALPEGFEAAGFQYKGVDVLSGKGLSKDLTLLYLKDAGGNNGFYIYNEGADTFVPFVQLNTSAKAIVIVPLDGDTVVPEGFEARTIDIDGKPVSGWIPKSEEQPEYCVVYGMNWDGNKAFYRYDMTEMTLQRYFAGGVSNEKYVKTAEDYNSLLKDYNMQFYFLIGLGVLALILFAVIIFLLRKGGGNGRDDHRMGRGKKELTPRRQEEDEWTAGGGFRPGSGVDSHASNVRRYTREEFDQEPEEEELFGDEGDNGHYEEDDESGEAEVFGMDDPDSPAIEEEFQSGNPDTEERHTHAFAAEESDDGDFDFEEAASLDEMEKELTSRLARHMKEEEPLPEEIKTVRPGKTGRQQDDDDFEFMDLDD